MVQQTLPADWYVDADIHGRERQAIFAGNWSLFGPERDFDRVGAWRADRVNGWPLFVIRGEDMVLRGFHNVCRHRGAALFPDQSGQCTAIRCPYHAWNYDLTGRLIRAPDFGESAGFDAGQYGLFPVRVEAWRGLVFVCLDDAAPDLAAWLGPLPELCRDYPAAPEMDYFGSFAIAGAANWKTYCDNTVEGYHLPHVHRRLSKAVVPSETRIHSHDDGRLIVFNVAYAHDGDALRGARGIWFYRFPGFQGVVGQRGFKAERIEPDGPSALKSTSWSWFRDLPDSERADAFQWAQQIVREDLAICETVQRNMAVGIYRTGVLSPKQESHTARFQELVREALGDVTSEFVTPAKAGVQENRPMSLDSRLRGNDTP
jgi:choline monooxygenase